MKSLIHLMQNIIRLTGQIETNYPELYKYLEETPLHLGEPPNGKVSVADLESYLEALKAQLKHHIETHHLGR